MFSNGGGPSKNTKTTVSPSCSRNNEAHEEQTCQGASVPMIIDLTSDDEDIDAPSLKSKVFDGNTDVPEDDQSLRTKGNGAALKNSKGGSIKVRCKNFQLSAVWLEITYSISHFLLALPSFLILELLKPGKN